MSATAEKQEERKPPQPAIEANLAPAETKSNTWHLDVVVPEDGVMPDDLKNEAYWQHLANKLRPFDHVHAFSEDRMWYAHFLVLDVGSNWAKVHLLEKHRLDADAPETRRLMSGYSVRFKGNIRLWAVLRDVDKKIIKDGMKSESEAYAFLADFARQNARTPAQQ